MRYRMLTRNNEFSRAYARGSSFVHPCLVLYVNKNRCGRNRIGLTATKKVGNAVQRNRSRRVLRAALDAVLPPDFCTRATARNQGVDLVLVARGATPKKKSYEIAAALARLCKQAGIACRAQGADKPACAPPAPCAALCTAQAAKPFPHSANAAAAADTAGDNAAAADTAAAPHSPAL